MALSIQAGLLASLAGFIRTQQGGWLAGSKSPQNTPKQGKAWTEYVFMCVCTYVCVYVCIYVCMYVRKPESVCIYVCMCVRMYVGM